MNTAARLAKNSAALLTASLVERISNILFIAVLVRYVSQEDLGIYTIVITFFEFGSLFADFGMSQVLIRDIAQQRDRASPIWSNALLLGGVWSSFGWLLLGATGTILGYPPQVLQLIWLIGAALVFRMIWLFSGAVLRAFERMEIVAVASGGYAVLFAIAGILCLAGGWQVPSLIGLIVLLTGLIGLGVFTIVHRRFAPFVPRVDLALWSQMVREVWPIASLLACDILLRRAGILFLSLMRPMQEVAIYGTAIKFVDTLSLLTTSLTGALLPHLASTWRAGVAAGWRTYQYSLRFFILLGIGLTAGALVLARPLLLLFMGQAYLASLVPLQILLLMFLLSFVGRPMGAMLLVSKEQLIAFIQRAALVVLFNIGLSLWLIPQHGYPAASWIAVISSAGFLFFTARVTRHLTDKRIPWRAFLTRPLLAASGMAVLLCLVREGSPVWTIPLGMLSYGLLLALLGEFRAPEYVALRQAGKALWHGRLAWLSMGRTGLK